ncbi:MAG: hypothetical protein LBS79_01900 [Tannerella sp.]|jgi:hypothetical protein|nr:hypothetical protein [Tannerella sp.]
MSGNGKGNYTQIWDGDMNQLFEAGNGEAFENTKVAQVTSVLPVNDVSVNAVELWSDDTGYVRAVIPLALQ